MAVVSKTVTNTHKQKQVLKPVTVKEKQVSKPVTMKQVSKPVTAERNCIFRVVDQYSLCRSRRVTQGSIDDVM